MVNYVVELTEPSFDGQNLSYAVNGVGDTTLPTAMQCGSDSNLFIDDVYGSCSGDTGKALLCKCTAMSQCANYKCVWVPFTTYGYCEI